MNIEQFLKRYGRGSHVSKQALRRLLASRLGIDEASVLAWPEREIPVAALPGLVRDAEALAAGRPEAYLLGFVPFLDWDFLCDERALIPRPETEDLVRIAIDRSRGSPPQRILDLCCGSGVIGLSLALAFPGSVVVLTDISADALALARANAAKHALQKRTRILRGDLWAPLGRGERFDLILANPPYVAEEDEVEESVFRHEPAAALFSGDAGTAHIKRILSDLPHRLNPRGLAAFELSHRHRDVLAPWLSSRFDPQTYHWERDPFGVPRYFIYDGVNGSDT